MRSAVHILPADSERLIAVLNARSRHADRPLLAAFACSLIRDVHRIGADRVRGAPGWGTRIGPEACQSAREVRRLGWGGVRCEVSGGRRAWPARA